MTSVGPELWRAQLDALRDLLSIRVPRLVGIYLHGSAALGGFGPTSDLDVLVVVEDLRTPSRDQIAQEILAVSEGGRDLELSVVRRRDAARPASPWPFVLHVNSGEHRWALGGQGGDPDLLAHYAVVRAAGVPLLGPDPSSVVGAVDRDALLAYLVDELAWGVAEADQRYAVLNACRAVVYAEQGELLSKQAGGRWWIARNGPSDLVTGALDAQTAGADLGACSQDARDFVGAARANLLTALRQGAPEA